jgi:hypothetical protein
MAKLVWVWNEMSKEMKWNQNAMMERMYLRKYGVIKTKKKKL